jgi:hypothetical protein
MPPNRISGKKIWISLLCVFIIKLLLVFAFCQLSIRQDPRRQIGNLSFASGDYKSYIGAMEKYIQHGKYYFLNDAGDTVVAGRAPHYAIPYWIARQFAHEPIAADFMTIFYILIDSIAVFCLALMTMAFCSNSLFAFYSILIIGTISGYVTNWSFITNPDCGGAGLFTIGIYFFWKAYQLTRNLKSNIFLSSFFFLWAIMLRPFLVLPIALIALIFIIRKRIPLKNYLSLIIPAALPVFLLLVPWVWRNYKETGKIIPFQQNVYAGYDYKPSDISTRRLMNSMGEDGGTFWDPSSMASFFSPNDYTTSSYRYPTYVKRDTFLYNNIEKLRTTYINTCDARNQLQEKELATQASILRRYYKKTYKIRYYLFNPVRRSIKFWGNSGSYYISAEKGNKLLLTADKAAQSLLYYLVLIFGTIGLVILGRRNDMGYILLIPVVTLTIMFPILLGFMEPRYALSFYYPGLLGLIIFLESVKRRIRQVSQTKYTAIA